MKTDERRRLIELLTEARVEVAAARHELGGCKKKHNDSFMLASVSTDSSKCTDSHLKVKCK